MPTSLSKLLGRVGNPLEWSTTDKSLAALGFVSLVAAGYAFWGSYLVAHPDLAPYLNLEFMARAVKVQLGELAIWLTLIAIGLAIRKRAPESRLFVHTLAQLYAFFNALGLYAIGQFSSTAGVTLLGNAFVGLLLFDLRVIIPAAIPTTLVLGVTAYGGWTGAMPYAPLLKESPFETGGKIAGWWLVNFGAVSVLIALGSLAVFGYIIHLWRDREAKLAAAYADLRQAQRRLVRAESLAAVGSLVTGAAHELRNPLSASSATLQSLKEELAGFSGLSPAQRSEIERSVDLALAGEQRATAIVERLYRLTDDLETQGSKTRIGQFLAPLLENYPGIACRIAQSVRPLAVHQPLLTSVIPNLLDNALAAGGTQPPALEITETGGQIRISVSDSGRGIASHRQGDVFKPFFTGEKAGTGHGVGLGLYIVHELVTRMGGTVELESEEGKGTRVSVNVPVGG